LKTVTTNASSIRVGWSGLATFIFYWGEKMQVTRNVFVQILIFLGVAMLFLNTVSPFETTKIATQWNLNLIGVLGSVVLFAFTKKKEIFDDFFTVKNYREFFTRFASGILWGIVTLILLAMAVKSFNFLINLFGSIPATTLASLSQEGAFFVVFVQPLTETVLLIAATLFLYNVFSSFKIPQPMATAIFAVAMLFAGFHFATVGKEYYEYSLAGFINFIGDTKNIESPDYHGGFPFIILGVFWLILAIIYKNFVEPFAAHLTYNYLVLLLNSNTIAIRDFLTLVGLSLIIIVVFAYYFTHLEKFGDFKLARLGGDLR